MDSFAVVLLSPEVAAAGDLTGRLEALERALSAAQSSADNAWMLTSAALVLLMTGPGLALFYGGLVRRKNVLATMMHSFILMAVASVLWAVVGYSLAFGGSGRFLGDLRFAFLSAVGNELQGTIPHATFVVYQLMFAIITPALISGAFAERIKFSAMLLFTALWSLLVYYPLAHMVWGPGGILNAFADGRIPCLDFAGGTVVHVSSGVSALVCALYLGKRLGYPSEAMKPHNLVMSVTGACLLWVGWFGFNAGSALAASRQAASAFLATQLGAAAATLGWMLAEWLKSGKPSMLGAITGAVAGLVAITPASGFVRPMPALVIGFAAGVLCFYMVAVVKHRLGYDDSLDAFGVHGVGGTVGAILTGIFATRAVVDPTSERAFGWVDGNPVQVLYQLAGTAVAWVLAAAGTVVSLKICDRVVGVRVEPEHEIQGLDLSLHGEEAYSYET
ncbi:MAG: ammonium transporter [Bryobacterales bacterium]|nr:ammonium transporter [Bryobacteraceae bacterium]MDW8128911.1 ammonium transporter [Bryobacterales bacterium]